MEEKTGALCPHCNGEILKSPKPSYIENSKIGCSNRRTDDYYCFVCQTMFIRLPPKDLFKARSEA